MKSIISLLTLFLVIGAVNGQNALELTFKKYKNDTDVTSITFDDKIMSYLKNDSGTFKTKIDKVEILIFTPDKDLSKSDIAKLEAAVQADNYEMLVNAKSKEGKAKIYGLSNANDNLQVLYAQVYSETANIYFMLKGDIHFDELSEMGLDFDGADIFKTLSEKKEDEKKKSKDK